MLDLRPYQQRGVDDIRRAFARHRTVLYVLPTGGGKTVLFAWIIWAARDKGRRTYILSHRAELVDQISATLDSFDVPHGYIAAGRKPAPEHDVQICMIDSLRRRIERVALPSFLVVDEAHHAVSPTWAKVLRHWQGVPILGVTATPERLDGRGLRDIFSAMVLGPTTGELIADGYLAPYDGYSIGTFDRDSLHTLGGDYRMDEAEGLVNEIVGDAIDHYRRHSDGQQGLVFACRVGHSAEIAARYQAAGIPAAHLDGTTPKTVRRAIVQDYRDGLLRVLCNCSLFGEGFDVPSASVVQVLRPTQSLALHLQMMGRVLRPGEGKRAVILDHVGNLGAPGLGLPDQERRWSLDSKARRLRDDQSAGVAVKVCPQCFRAVPQPVKVCGCGFEFISKPSPGPREVDGELVKIERVLPYQRARMIRDADSLEELRGLARRLGYKKGWAWHVWKSRREKRA